MPMLAGRLVQGSAANGLLERGKVLIPEIMARGMKIKPGDTVVLVATNLDGSVNGKTFIVQGVLGDVTGPGGRDGYMHMDDARALLRMTEAEVSEIAVRLKNLGQLAARRRRSSPRRSPTSRTRRASRCSTCTAGTSSRHLPTSPA